MTDHLEQRIEEGDRVRAFIEDPAVKAALLRLEQKYFTEFRDADDAGKREAVWAKTRALTDIATELRTSVDRATHAKAELERSNPRTSPRTPKKS